MKKYPVLILIITLSSCTLTKVATLVTKEKVEPIAFKTSIPIRIGKFIELSTYWGENKYKKILIFDTGASYTTADSSITTDKNIATLIGKAPFAARTPDGKKTYVEFYSTETISIGDVSFNPVVFISSSLSNFSNAFNKSAETPVGLFGINLLSKGIWKINFKDSTLTFTSSIDSIGNITELTEVPIHKNLNSSFSLDATFKNSISRKLTIDFGFNGMILLPKDVFENIDTENQAVSRDTLTTTLASISKTTIKKLEGENVTISNKIYSSQIVTNDIVNFSLIGLRFFTQFDYVILDFPKSKLYLPKSN